MMMMIPSPGEPRRGTRPKTPKLADELHSLTSSQAYQREVALRQGGFTGTIRWEPDPKHGLWNLLLAAEDDNESQLQMARPESVK